MPVPARLPSVEIAVSLMVAVTTPVVWASILLAWATVAVPLLTFAVTLPAVLIDDVAITSAISSAPPVMVVTALAFTPVVVLLSMIFRSAAAAEPASMVTPTAEAVSIPKALIAAAIFAALPVIVATGAAFTLTVVLASSAFRSAALTVPSLTVML